MSRSLRTSILALAALVAGSGLAGASPVSYYNNADGSSYVLDASHVGSLYTFTFTADFTGVTTSEALGDRAMLVSFKSKNTANWSLGSLVAAPGTDSNWQIVQDDSNSNGCKGGEDFSQWCIELKHTSGSLTGPVIATGTVLTWRHTMTLTSGTPDFGVNWPFKFTTTTGDWDAGKGDWVFGGYQISQELVPCAAPGVDCVEIDEFDIDQVAVPEPASVLLLAGGLLALVGVRRVRRFRA